ncbi:MAG: ammonia channel protein [Rhodospirillaceae bacterium TMED8]|nr:ammonia channel protein [Magnetovibrio sp.]OUT48909.1 MAG: ammonia channel protein [Rhodospirillaceae bacterium TMED8]|tara:strand:- start:376 stop:1683 length:1308 start_codon:yes stop_codon:yes gene_type:complete
MKINLNSISIPLLGVGLLLIAPDPASATDTLDAANTAWILTSTALVLFMTLPGLALFYAGLVQAKNVLSVMMHCFTIACMASVLWLVLLYSLAFDNGGAMNAIIGGLGKVFMNGIGFESLTGDIPESVFFMFQMTFAIITPALMVGAYVERMRFSAVIVFSTLWLIFIYAPVCHWVWGGGWLASMGVMDFAGGLVVHATAGTSVLIVVKTLGNRNGFPTNLQPPHSPGLTMIGAAMLWVGWFGFNAGSALSADGNAGMAMTVTHISAATASLTWVVIEWKTFGKPSLIGIVTGMVAGLATITPASGFVGPIGGFCIGLAGGIVCYYAVSIVKNTFYIDDSLDVFAVHGIGGIIGTLLAAIFGVAIFGGVGLPEGTTILGQLGVQATGAVAIVIWSAFASYIILKFTSSLTTLRASDDEITEGMDLAYHGEKDYNF